MSGFSSTAAIVRSALATARVALRSSPGLAVAGDRLAELSSGLDARMRVALVGRISAGKSTLANALLGGYRAPTGVNELTFNVNWISHGVVPSLTVHFVDGRPPEPRDIGELEQLTVRPAGEPDSSLNGIAYLRITDPANYLTAFDLIDTPGLDSVLGTDTRNTLRFLDGPVDAVVLTFARTAHVQDAGLLRRFQGADLSPINAIGVLTRVEDYWDWPEQPDPLGVGERVIAQLDRSLHRLAYRIRPVASLVAAAAATLDDADLADLLDLARMPVDDLGYELGSADGFARRGDRGPVPSLRRASLFRRLSGYGIMLSTEIIRGGVDTLPELRRELDRRSGMTGFRELLGEHFGARADLIKLNRVYGGLQALPDDIGAQLGARDRLLLRDTVREICKMALRDSTRMRELEVLRAHYAGQLDLSEADAADLLRVTGETGRGLRVALDLAPEATVDELRAVAVLRARRWAELDVLGRFTGPTRLAVSVLRRSYDRILAELDDIRAEAR